MSAPDNKAETAAPPETQAKEASRPPRKKRKVAVALKYPEGAEAPFISAKGSYALAERIIEIAKENDIPLVEDDIVGEVLSLRQIGEYIPESTWEAIAAVFAFIKSEEKAEKHKR